MAGTGASNVDGVGTLTYQRAIDIARNTEGELDSNVKTYLDGAVRLIWNRVLQQPDSYILRQNRLLIDTGDTTRSSLESNRADRRFTSNFICLQYKLVLTVYQQTRRQAILAKGPTTMHQSRAADRRASRHAEDEKIATASLYPPDESGKAVGLSMSAILSFAESKRNRMVKMVLAVLVISILSLSFAKSFVPCSKYLFTDPGLSVRSLPHHARAAASSFLEVFQVYPPVLTVTPSGVLEITDGSSNATVEIVNSDRPTCQEVLAVHSFAFSYGEPFVGTYTPPSCTFNRVTWNLTVVSAGRQFDRLGIVYFGNIELFRTSTAEPTADGIEWTYLKDMTNFLPLFKTEQKIIFDLGNLISNIYTAAYNVTLTASFFTADDSITPADLILPVSERNAAKNQPSVFTVPPQTAVNDITLPRNVKKAVFTIAATGQIDEEFWWSNVPQSQINTFPAYGTLYGYSPFREVQLFIDGALAGVAWPFPVIFTGGVVPGLWRPIVGIDAFDLKEDEIDITPWLPLLCDGNSHSFTIRVSGLNDTGTGSAVLSGVTDGYWLITGKIFLWLDAEGHVTTGDGPRKVTPTPSFQVTSSVAKSANGTNETLFYQVNAQRSLSIQSTLDLSHGKEIASWRQSLTYSNTGNYTEQGFLEINEQDTNAYAVSSSGYARQIGYPLYAYSLESFIGDNISLIAIVDRGKDVKTLGQPVFPTGLESFSAAEAVHPRYPQFEGASLSTTQNGMATYLANETAETSFSFGTTEQDFLFSGIRVGVESNPHSFPTIDGSEELFHRHVLAVNSSVVEDEETLIDTPIGHEHGPPSNGRGFVLSNVPGRGNHWHRMARRRRV